MNPQNIRAFLRAEPFVPFRIHATEGRSYDVRYPDEALVLATRVTLPDVPKKGNMFPDHVEHIALSLVVRLEELAS